VAPVMLVKETITTGHCQGSSVHTEGLSVPTPIDPFLIPPGENRLRECSKGTFLWGRCSVCPGRHRGSRRLPKLIGGVEMAVLDQEVANLEGAQWET
jgi:hypothetical protein